MKHEFKKSKAYKIASAVLGMPKIALFMISLTTAVVLGIMMKEQSEVYKNIGQGLDDNIMKSIILLNILIPLVGMINNFFTKGYKLTICNDWWLRVFERALKSKISDISEVGVGSIMNAASEIAGLKANQATIILSIIQVMIPFIIVAGKIFALNPVMAIIMVVIMIVCVLGYLYGDKLFHFNTVKSEMKGHMQQITVSNYQAIKMLKYVNAANYATKVQKDVQDECSTACNNPVQVVYNGVLNFFINVPCVLALYVAFQHNDSILALFIAFNEWTISNMVGLISDYVSNQSELEGVENTIDKLKEDDVAYDEKPVMPEKLILKDIEFHYASDTDIKNPYEISKLVIERGKRYRIDGVSGIGKSSLLKYFAGEMDGAKAPDVRIFYVHQQTELLYDTLRNNITQGNKYVPDTVIEQLLEDIGMGDWLRALPDGLDTMILGEGVHPSGGEASRISLMRLFIHIRNYQKGVAEPVRNTSDIIMLDEVTSALDKRTRWLRDDEYCTEEKVIDVIDRETKGCTMLVISHEDESSTALGFRNIVDYTIHVHGEAGNDGMLHHIIDSAIPNDNKTSTNITMKTSDILSKSAVN